MNILQAHKYFWRRDGASNYMVDLSKQLQKNDHKVVPFSLDQEETIESRYDNFFVTYFDISNPEKYSLAEKIEIAAKFVYNWEAKNNIEQLINELDFKLDLAHLHNIYHHISPSILPAIKKNRASTVMTLHDYKLICPNYTMFYDGQIREQDCKGWYLSCIKDRSMKSSLAQSILVTLEMIIHHKIWGVYEKYIDQFITPSKFMKQKCIEHGWSEEKFSHIPNPINADKFEFSDKEGDYVAYIGRLSEEKGLDTLLDAAKKLSDIPFYLTGSGDYQQHLKTRCREENINNVTFDGFLTGKKLKSRIKQADMLVLPSIWYENYPISVLEAKAMGRIVIGSKIGGIPEQLPNELLFEPKNSIQLSEKIEKWFNKPKENKKELRKQLRAEVEQENDPDQHLQQILNVYKSVL